MTELSPFSILLIITQWKLVNKISQEPLELGHDIWIIDCVLDVDDLINFL